MSLSAVLNSARSSLSAISGRTKVVSENISNIDNPAWSRRISENISGRHGVLRVGVNRAQDGDLLTQLLSYTSRSAADAAMQQGLDKIGLVFGDAGSETAPAALIARLQTELQTFAAMPDNAAAAASAVEAARAVAQALGEGARAVANLRQTADGEIAASVERINGLLEQFHEANSAIVTGRLSDEERVRNEDARDHVLMQLAEELDIRTVARPDGGIAIYSGSGAVLYERGVRKVRFQPSAMLAPGAPGGQIFIDNVPVSGAQAVMPLRGGRLSSLVRLRDQTLVQWQAQLDETARGLIEAFAETDQGNGARAPGLFTWSGAPAMPAAGTLVPGLAADLRLNPAADPAAGGDPFTLRDGGMAGAAYVENASGVAGYTERLLALNAALDAPRAFDPAAGLQPSASVKDFSASSVSWLEQGRADAHRDAEYSSTLLSRASEALSRKTGVDLDDELALMMKLERSYAASARLISAVDGMLQDLINAVR